MELFENLLRNVEEKGGITQNICVDVSDEQVEILTRKAELLGVTVEVFLRTYLLETSVFDNSHFEAKKVKKVVKKEANSEGSK